MADNAFNSGMNAANTAFGAIAREQFEVLRGTPGVTIPGFYDALSIDDLKGGTSVVPGGLRGDNATIIFIDRAVFAGGGMNDGTVLKVRGRNVRINTISDDGDNMVTLICEPPGIKMSQ